MDHSPVENGHSPIVIARNSPSGLDLPVLGIREDTLHIEMDIVCPNDNRFRVCSNLELNGEPAGTGRDDGGPAGGLAKIVGRDGVVACDCLHVLLDGGTVGGQGGIGTVGVCWVCFAAVVVISGFERDSLGDLGRWAGSCCVDKLKIAVDVDSGECSVCLGELSGRHVLLCQCAGWETGQCNEGKTEERSEMHGAACCVMGAFGQCGAVSLESANQCW